MDKQVFSILHESEYGPLITTLKNLLYPGCIVLLFGEIGMGKTTFIRTLLQNLGVDRPIPSPTFSLIQAYEPAYFPSLPWPVLHADLYRIKELEEVFELDILNPYQKVTFIEWPERLGHLLPQKNISLYFHSAPIGRTVTLIEN